MAGHQLICGRTTFNFDYCFRDLDHAVSRLTAVLTLSVIYLAGFQLADRRVGEAKTDLEQVVIRIRLFCETHCFHSEPLTQGRLKRILERPPKVIELREQFLRRCSAGKHFLDFLC